MNEQGDVVAGLDAGDERAITSLIYQAAEASDEQRYLDWMDLFADDAEYSVITRDNLEYKGLRLCRDVGKAALHERVAFLMGMIQTPRGRTAHLVGNLRIDEAAPGAARVTSKFVITRTGRGQMTQLYASGVYQDRLELRAGRWLFRERLVIVDGNLLPASFSELL